MPDILSHFFIFAGQSLLNVASVGVFMQFYIWCFDQHRRRRRLRRYDLRGKIVLITGASSGLGRALAKEFYLAGSKVIVAARSLEKLRELCDELKSLDFRRALPPSRRNARVRPLEPIFHYLDLADGATVEEMAADILKTTRGRLDVLVNNAGVSFRGTCEETSTAVHRRVMEVNYFGQVELTRLLMPAMVKTAATQNPAARGPCIVGISSVQGRFSIPYRSAYSASKHAFQAYFDCLRSELSIARRTAIIRVLVVSPGYLATDLSINAIAGDGSRYGKLDDTTKNGLAPEVAAQKIVRGVIECESELILAPCGPKTLLALRPLLPEFYFWWAAKRARKLNQCAN